MGKSRVGLLTVEGILGEATGALAKLEEAATIGGKFAQDPGQRRRIAGRVGHPGTVAIDEVGEFTGEGVDERQPSRRVVACFVGHGHE